MATRKIPFGHRYLATEVPDPAPSMTAAPGTIGVFCADSLRYTDFVTDVYSVRCPEGSRMAWGTGLEVSVGCNTVVRSMLDDPKQQWIFLVGDDHRLRPDTVERLLDRLDQHPELDAVAALVLRRTPPWQTVAYAANPRHDGTPLSVGRETGVIEVEAVGNSGLLIRRRVFERLSEPYFRVGQIDPQHYQEDVEFCERARKLGFRFGLDTSTPMGHITPMTVWPARDATGKLVVALEGRGGALIPVDPTPDPDPALERTNREELVNG